MAITFEKATSKHIDIIFEWLAEPHMIEFWDNSQEHKNDILNFIHGRKQTYFAGTTQYWMGYVDGTPHSFILTDLCQDDIALTDLHRKHLSKTGHTYFLDFGLGNKAYLGKGLAAPTLIEFAKFYSEHVDKKADTFFIDPADNNPRARHVYGKAGFVYVGDFEVTEGAFKQSQSHLMVKRL